jgi:hypothetical protein
LVQKNKTTNKKNLIRAYKNFLHCGIKEEKVKKLLNCSNVCKEFKFFRTIIYRIPKTVKMDNNSKIRTDTIVESIRNNCPKVLFFNKLILTNIEKKIETQ